MAALRLALAGLAASALSMIAAVAMPAAPAPDRQASESAIKAAYVLHFASYVEWSRAALPRPESAVRIGVMEDRALGLELEASARGRSVAGHPIEVVELDAGSEIPALHVLFVGRAVDRRLPEVLATEHGKGVLLVTEVEDALRHGSIVNFVVVDDRVRFDISLDSARDAGLRLSSRLLDVARKVVGEP